MSWLTAELCQLFSNRVASALARISLLIFTVATAETLAADII